jgi:hypothetical protein
MRTPSPLESLKSHSPTLCSRSCVSLEGTPVASSYAPQTDRPHSQSLRHALPRQIDTIPSPRAVGGLSIPPRSLGPPLSSRRPVASAAAIGAPVTPHPPPPPKTRQIDTRTHTKDSPRSGPAGSRHTTAWLPEGCRAFELLRWVLGRPAHAPHSRNGLNMMHELWPPKPKELDRATLTSTDCASEPHKMDRSTSSSGSSRFKLGCSLPACAR